MILLLLSIGCTPDHNKSPGKEEEAESPDPGRYAVNAAAQFVGDCALEDPATYAEPVQSWVMDPRGDVLILYPDSWDTWRCSLEGMDFACDWGSWEVTGRRPASFSRVLVGSFSATNVFLAQDTVTMSCEEGGCDDLRDLYGADLNFPCTVTAEYAGVGE